ncbi:MAG: hypothetical protein PUC98_07600, partial [Clostridiales bacterium]|nr:hypothetical protein [Clostridiales bacterium]
TSDETYTNVGETGTGSDENEELTGTNGSSESTGSTEESDGSGSNVNTDDSSETGITGSEIETPSSGSGSTGGNANAENTGAAGETAAANDKALQSAGTFALRTVQTASVSDTCQNFTLTDVGLSVVDNSIKIHSGADLIKLSHVAPSYYNGKILNFVSTDSSGYDTTQILDINVGSGEQAQTYSLSFAGLDFINGTVLVASGSENFPIKLKRPLFNTLSDQVVISFGADANSSNGTGSGAGLSLMYMAKTGETLDTDIPVALLAEKVVHQAANAQTEEYSELLSETEGLSESSNVSDDENASETASDVPEAASNTSETENNNIWSIRPIASDINGRMPTLIGTIDNNAKVTLSLDLPVGDSNSLYGVTQVMESCTGSGIGSGAGLLCAVMNRGSVLTLESLYRYGSSMPSVSATGNAGSLVGTMNAGSSLILADSTFVLSDITSTAGDAGGLVGAFIDADISAKDQNTISISSDNQKTISGLNAGGLAGSCTYNLGEEESTAKTISLSNIEISGITLTGKGSNPNGNAGGVFGVLNTTGKGTIVFENSISTDVTLTANNNAGGLIGQYSANDLDGTLRLDSGRVVSYLSGAVTVDRPSAYGGLIGWVKNGAADGAAYIEVNSAADENASETEEKPVTASDTETGSNTCTVSVKGTANSFGGLIGSLSDSGHFLKVGTVSINMNSAGGSNYAGGLVGKFDSGVLWIAGDADTVLPNCGNNKNKGNYVGYRGNTLVFSSYTSGEGYSWNFNNGWNDIGNWGQVLQVSTLPGLFTVKNHRITVTSASTDESDESIEVSDVPSFAQAALRFQLDAKGALVIENDIDPDTTEIDIDPNTTEIKLSGGSINLTGTGLTGFQRDYSSAQPVNVNITCTSNTEIKFHDMAVSPDSNPIPIYGGKGSHDRQGLFSKTGNLSVVEENAYLTLSGSISVSAIDQSVYIGSLTAESCGSVTANRVISNTSLSIASAKKEERVAGIVAHQKGGSGSAVLSVDLDGCKLGKDFSINYDGSNVCFLGGLIARIENGCRVSIENCAITGSITKTGSGECYAGGLIASLRDNETGTLGNILTINGLTADGVTINAENATKTGGILGWEWMTDTADIQGVTVKDCTLNAGSARFGGLVYKGNGYWSVHGSGIKFIKGLQKTNSFTGGSSDSGVSGLFLADGTKGKDHKNALYLEIQSGAYTIEDSNTIEDSSITLVLNDGNSSSTVFDEIIGTTEDTDASDGSGNGIVSIGTGFTGSPKASDCSYTKKFSDYHNSKTRYYYNLDVFRGEAAGSGGSSSPAAASGDIDSSGKMVLYSAYTHCYSGIKNYFYSN